MKFVSVTKKLGYLCDNPFRQDPEAPLPTQGLARRASGARHLKKRVLTKRVDVKPGDPEYGHAVGKHLNSKYGFLHESVSS